MSLSFKKLTISVIYNLVMFLLVMIGIQNSSEKMKVAFISAESVRLPVSFIIGLSFISGSLIGGCIDIERLLKRKNNLL